MSSPDKQPMTRVKVSLPPEVDDAIESLLEYGDSKSAWLRGAAQMRLRGDLEDGSDEKHDQ